MRLYRFLMPVCLTGLSMSFSVAAETLGYVAHYKGVFSLFEEISIADVELQTAGVDAELPALQKTSLSVSSEAHSTVERLYPFRYRFDSYFDEEKAQTLIFEHLKSSKDKKKHYLGFIDTALGQAQLFKSKAQQMLISLPVLLDFEQKGMTGSQFQRLDLQPKSPLLTNMQQGVMDRLTLLSQIREQIRKNLSQKDYQITNGDKLMKYRVSILRRENLSLREKTIAALKVKIEAWAENAEEMQAVNYDDVLNLTREPQPNYLHAPVYAWFSADSQAVPLKFLNKHSVGEFTIQIKDHKQLNKVALSN